jgi:CO/xanthine dehydrogenase Mo-binding subunit
VFASTQKPHELFQLLVDLLALDENRLRVVAADVGGGFGPKLCVYPEDIAVVAAAKLLRRSVKWIEDRREHFVGAVHERDQHWWVEIAVEADGRLRGVRGRLLHDQGAYALQEVNNAYNAAVMVPSVYVLPAYAMELVVVHNNKVPVSSVRVVRYVAIQDSGRIINPLIVDGQVRGGVVHGIGNAVLERMGYDEAGQPLTMTFQDYLLATAVEAPAVETRYRQSPSPLNPLGVKGAGEVGTIPAAAAVVSAIEDALTPFGVRISEVPVSPQRLVELIAASPRS